MKTYSLFELNEFIRRILALNLAEAIWVKGEFAQLNEARGHYFIDLVQKEDDKDDIIAQASAVLWAKEYRRLRRQVGKTLDQLLQEGIQVLVKVKVDFHERYGYKLLIEDIDPSFTLGKLEVKRRAIIDRLRKEKLIHQNGRIPLPFVAQNVAVLSSETAAGYQDFLKQLATNPYGYQFNVKLFPTAVQGIRVEEELTHQLKRIRLSAQKFDVVTIIRGGGARLDLMAFDNYNLAKAIAKFPLPVLTGIGHEVDETITDLVANQALKTPTAVAEFLINHQLQFEGEVMSTGQEIQKLAMEALNLENFQLKEVQQNLYFYSQQYISEERRMLDYIKGELPRYARFKLKSAKDQLHFLSEMSVLLSPEATLKRGYSLTQKEGKIIRDPKQLKEGDQINTQLAEGKISSIITKNNEQNEK